MSAQKFLSLIMALLLLSGAFLFSVSEEAITFESIESKTIDDGAVFNQVSFETHGDEDIWKMKQSHGGPHLELKNWDELRIRVNKKKRPFQVSYHQLKDGKEIEYKVSCYFCHSNGPRIIRPELKSKEAPLALKQRVQIELWNLRMKTYGKVEIKKESYFMAGKERITPLKYFGKNDVEALKLPSCTICHQDTFWGRGFLTRQQALPIVHLVKTGNMPPWPFKISPEDKEKLDNYLKGFRI